MGRTQREKYLSCALGGVIRIGYLRKQNHELVSALTADGVRTAHAGHQPSGNGLQKLVADGVSERIIYVFESIQIDKHHGSRYRPTASQRNRLSDPVIEHKAVGQVFHSIVLRDVCGFYFYTMAVDGVPKSPWKRAIFDLSFNQIVLRAFLHSFGRQRFVVQARSTIGGMPGG